MVRIGLALSTALSDSPLSETATRTRRDVWNAHIYSTSTAGDENTAKPTIKQSRPYPSRIHHGDICLRWCARSASP